MKIDESCLSKTRNTTPFQFVKDRYAFMKKPSLEWFLQISIIKPSTVTKRLTFGQILRNSAMLDVRKSSEYGVFFFSDPKLISQRHRWVTQNEHLRATGRSVEASRLQERTVFTPPWDPWDPWDPWGPQAASTSYSGAPTASPCQISAITSLKYSNPGWY